MKLFLFFLLIGLVSAEYQLNQWEEIEILGPSSNQLTTHQVNVSISTDQLNVAIIFTLVPFQMNQTDLKIGWTRTILSNETLFLLDQVTARYVSFRVICLK